MRSQDEHFKTLLLQTEARWLSKVFSLVIQVNLWEQLIHYLMLKFQIIHCNSKKQADTLTTFYKDFICLNKKYPT